MATPTGHACVEIQRPVSGFWFVQLGSGLWFPKMEKAGSAVDLVGRGMQAIALPGDVGDILGIHGEMLGGMLVGAGSGTRGVPERSPSREHREVGPGGHVAGLDQLLSLC